MSMRAGDLRHRISIQRPELTQDQQTGEMITTWRELAKVWAKVEPLSVREFIAAASTQSQITARITVRASVVVDETCRVVYRGKDYNVEGVLADPESGLEYKTLPCSEGVRDG